MASGAKRARDENPDGDKGDIVAKHVAVDAQEPDKAAKRPKEDGVSIEPAVVTGAADEATKDAPLAASTEKDASKEAPSASATENEPTVAKEAPRVFGGGSKGFGSVASGGSSWLGGTDKPSWLSGSSGSGATAADKPSWSTSFAFGTSTVGLKPVTETTSAAAAAAASSSVTKQFGEGVKAGSFGSLASSSGSWAEAAPKEKKDAEQPDESKPTVAAGEPLAPATFGKDAPSATAAVDPSQLVTGEEDDKIEFQARVKLFIMDEETKGWKERGVGELHVNLNRESNLARLIMRLDGSRRLALNAVLVENAPVCLYMDVYVRIACVFDDKSPRTIVIRTRNGDDAKRLLAAIKRSCNVREIQPDEATLSQKLPKRNAKESPEADKEEKEGGDKDAESSDEEPSDEDDA